MKIRRITPYHIRVPLKFRFAHAGAERDSSDNIVVEAELEDGTRGWGECVPRKYVTGETIEGLLESYRALNLDCDFKGFDEAWEFFKAWEFSGGAARCAVELAVLDAFGRHFKVPLGEGRDRGMNLYYSGVLGRRGSAGPFKMRLFGFRDIKIKVGFGAEEDIRQVRKARRVLGRKVDIRVDANGTWEYAQAEEMISHLSKFRISSVEQPLKRGHESLLSELRRRVGLPIMLDESICSLADAERAIRNNWCDSFNIRLSKCGGLTPSLKIAEMARRNNLKFQLGAQVGETGILSAAGRAFASRASDAIHLEGSYDAFLLKRNTTTRDVSFGYGGRAHPLTGYGLGIEVDRENLCKMHVER